MSSKPSPNPAQQPPHTSEDVLTLVQPAHRLLVLRQEAADQQFFSAVQHLKAPVVCWWRVGQK